jgi:hypothetical protein
MNAEAIASDFSVLIGSTFLSDFRCCKQGAFRHGNAHLLVRESAWKTVIGVNEWGKRMG